MGPNRKYQKLINKQSIVIQSFPEVCRYSCSKNNETRNFRLYRNIYQFEFRNFKLKLWESVTVTCDNCNWSASLPGSLARKIFKHGLRAGTLIRYSKDRFLSSIIVNIWGSLWRVFLGLFMVFIVLVIYKYYSSSVITSTPKEISFDELKNGRNVGQIVKVTGNVDYTLAFTKDNQIEDKKGIVSVTTEEVYMPIFSPTDNNDFIVLRGGNNDIQNVLGRQGITDETLLKNQTYTVEGKVENIDSLQNEQLRTFFTSELPKSRNSSPAKLVINSVNLITLQQFISFYLSYFIVFLFLAGSSIFLQIYIDRKIVNK